MLPCGRYTSFCCGQGEAARNCCTTENGVVEVPAGYVVFLDLATTTVCESASCTAIPSPESSSGARQFELKDMVGIGVGFAAGLVIAAAAAAFFWVKWRTTNTRYKNLQDAVREEVLK
jgi:hypothetical protein